MRDKRVFPRVRISNEISLILKGETKDFKVVDISQGGLSFISSEVLDPGVVITLDLEKLQSLDLVVLEGSFEWLCEDSVRAGYKVRCQFKTSLEKPTWDSVKNQLLLPEEII